MKKKSCLNFSANPAFQNEQGTRSQNQEDDAESCTIEQTEGLLMNPALEITPIYTLPKGKVTNKSTAKHSKQEQEQQQEQRR
jgi:hypothetical protein